MNSGMENTKQQSVGLLLRVALLTLSGSFIYAIYSGIRSNYGIMLGSIVESSGISFSSVSFVLAVGQFVFGLVQPIFGAVAAKKGNIYAVVAGIVLSVMGMLLTPMCRSALSLMLCLGILLPAGSGAVSYGIIIGTITPQIPPKTAATVSGVVNASSGIGNTIFSPIINGLIRTGGLMHCMLVLMIPVLLTWPVSRLMEKKKETPDDRKATTGAQAAIDAPAIRIKSLFRVAAKSRTYRLLIIGFFTCGFHMALITNHLPTQIQSFGISAEATSYAFSIYGITTIIGSIISGGFCARLKMKNVLGFLYGLRPITILAFLLLPKTLFTATLFTALFGFSGGSTVPPVSGLIGREFGATNLATLFGVVFVFHQIGGFFGAWLGGICFDMTGSYTMIWSVSLVFSMVASAASFAIRHS